VAVDRSLAALAGAREAMAGAGRIAADAARLPLAGGTFDLVFCQFALLWLDVPAVLGEIRRVLAPGGVLAALEPDYGGMIEHPPEIATRDIWLAALGRAGADPRVGRKLPGLLAEAGFDARVDLLDRLESPSPARFDLLAGLPLAEHERKSLQQARRADAACPPSRRTVHLPTLLITAGRTDGVRSSS
jgi:SAM-dependent methyltransferase